jgi:hypothetical protein
MGHKQTEETKRKLRIYATGRFPSEETRRKNSASHIKKTVEQRFWEKVDKNGAICERLGSRCWVWMAGKNKDGYGKFAVDHRKTIASNRMAWELVNGPITDGLCVLHKCDNPPCCNPGHLFLGTNYDNIVDMVTKGRSWSIDGENNYKHKLTWSDVIAIRDPKNRIYTTRQLANQYNVHKSTIQRVLNGERWKPPAAAMVAFGLVD